ncbi:MAG TPA: MBL fold metallo-hydrolase [Candidatus Acidoferrales bacterium]|nr:MBL fold metallo-hydrolase [Candidatus Acidoferrales bacterium]
MGDRLIHEILPVGLLQCNCSIVGDPGTREAVVIDPGDEIDRIREALERHRLRVRAIVCTHAHIDHVGGLAKLHRATGAPVVMHASDLELYLALPSQAEWLGIEPPEMTEVEGFLSDGDELRWGELQAQVIHTPGHSRGSLSLYLAAAAPGPPPAPAGTTTGAPLLETPRLFAGDTLFAGSIGRTDLWGGSFSEILRSIHQKLLVLPEDTIVYPGHGASTTIAREKQTNPFLRLA